MQITGVDVITGSFEVLYAGISFAAIYVFVYGGVHTFDVVPPTGGNPLIKMNATNKQEDDVMECTLTSFDQS